MLTACETDLYVGITLNENGSGKVSFALTLDEATHSKYPSFFKETSLNDLSAGGWSERLDPVPAANELAYEKSFTNTDQIGTLLSEIGPGLSISRVERLRSSEANTIALQGLVDVRQFSENITRGTAVDISSLPDSAAQLHLNIRLGNPGSYQERNWTIPLNSRENLEFSHTHIIENNPTNLWGWVAIAGASLFAVALLFNFLGWLSQRSQSSKLRKRSAAETA